MDRAVFGLLLKAVEFRSARIFKEMADIESFQAAMNLERVILTDTGSPLVELLNADGETVAVLQVM